MREGLFSNKRRSRKLGVILRDYTLSNKNSDKILYDPKYDISKGQGWWEVDNMESASNRFFAKKGAELAAFFEMPYFGIGNTVYTQKNTREFGADFAKALLIYLMEGEK